MSASVALVSVDYTEYQPWTLRGFVVEVGDQKQVFQTLEEAYEYAFENADRVMNLSSVDDYSSDLKNHKQH